MYVIIPMSGVGKRFTDAGYTVPKPLIEVDGKPMIHHVVNLFDEDKYVFICNEYHLNNTDMREIILSRVPDAEIISINRHKKGPVFALKSIFGKLNQDEEVIVNYCDVSKYWDYKGFLQDVRSKNSDGALSAHRGFHPHMLGTDNYAFMRSDEEMRMVEIKEKMPFTDDRMNEFASDGTYYFRTVSLMEKYCQLLMDGSEGIKGEHYVSMAYNGMVGDGLKVSIYEIDHMLQWGTPKDLEEYNSWSSYFKNQISYRRGKMKASTVMMPLAGRGERFVGYDKPKPLIEISGKPMVVQARGCLPDAERTVFVCLEEHYNFLEEWLDGDIIRLPDVTDGQACTCERGVTLGGIDPQAPLIVGSCDSGMIFDNNKLESAMEDYDALIWTFKNSGSTKINPKMYTYVRVDGTKATGVSMKLPITDDPSKDHAVVGVFSFKKSATFMGELISSGYKVGIFEIDSYVGWGTPDDLRVFKYWQEFFHKCDWHDYSLDLDPSMNEGELGRYNNSYISRKNSIEA